MNIIRDFIVNLSAGLFLAFIDADNQDFTARIKSFLGGKICIPIVLCVFVHIIFNRYLHKRIGLNILKWLISPYLFIMIWAFYARFVLEKNLCIDIIITSFLFVSLSMIFLFLFKKYGNLVSKRNEMARVETVNEKIKTLEQKNSDLESKLLDAESKTNNLEKTIRLQSESKESGLKEDTDLIKTINKTKNLVLSTSLIPIDRWCEKGYLYLLHYQTSLSISKFVNQLNRNAFVYLEEMEEKEKFDTMGANKLLKVKEALETKDLDILSNDHFSFRFFIYNNDILSCPEYVDRLKKIYYLHHFNAMHCIFLRKEFLEDNKLENLAFLNVCNALKANEDLKMDMNPTASIIPDIMLLDLKTVYYESRNNNPVPITKGTVLEATRNFFIQLINRTIDVVDQPSGPKVEFSRTRKNIFDRTWYNDLPLIPKKKEDVIDAA